MCGLCGYILVKGSKLKAPAQNVIYPQHDYQNVIESSLPFERDPTTVMWNVELWSCAPFEWHRAHMRLVLMLARTFGLINHTPEGEQWRV